MSNGRMIFVPEGSSVFVYPSIIRQSADDIAEASATRTVNARIDGDDLEPVWFDSMGAPIYRHQIG